MRILQLCKKFPYPVKDGESLAITYLGKALHQLGCEISLLAMNTSKHHSNASSEPQALAYYKNIDVIEIDNQLKIKDAFLNLFKDESYHISRFISENFAQKLKSILEKKDFDIVQLETLYLAPYISTIRKYSNAKIIMRSHNVEHEIWERITSNTQSGLKKWYLSHLTQKLKTYEINRLNDYDLFAAITQRDLNRYVQLGFKGNAVNIPIGIDIKDYAQDFTAFQKPISLSFIGSLDWMPNIEGLQWFLNQVWDKIHQQNPKITFHIAGRNAPNWLLNLKKKNIIVHGEVEDAHEFINQHSIMVVPLKSGSGMRVKILEAMALGRLVITTTIGVEGIHAKHKNQILIADTTSDFIEAVAYCKAHQHSLVEMGKKAQDFIGKEFDNTQIAERLLENFRTLTLQKTNSTA